MLVALTLDRGIELQEVRDERSGEQTLCSLEVHPIRLEVLPPQLVAALQDRRLVGIIEKAIERCEAEVAIAEDEKRSDEAVAELVTKVRHILHTDIRRAASAIGGRPASACSRLHVREVCTTRGR